MASGWAHSDSFGNSNTCNAFINVTHHSFSMFVNVHVLAGGCCFSEDAPVSVLEAIFQDLSRSLQPCSDLLCLGFALFSSGLYAGVNITVM